MTPFQPNGMKPPPALKLPPWKEVETSTTIVNTGTAIFHHVATLLVSESQRTPMMLMTEKISISTPATTYPWAVTTGVPPEVVVSPEM